MQPTGNLRQANPQAIEKQIMGSLAQYLFWGTFWRAVQYVFGVAAVIVSGLPAVKEIWSDVSSLKEVGRFGAFASPIMVGLIAFLRARQYADSWLLSWRLLNVAWLKYQASEVSPTELLDAWERAEAVEVKDVKESG